MGEKLIVLVEGKYPLSPGLDKTPNTEWRNGGTGMRRNRNETEPECDGTGMSVFYRTDRNATE